ncbi:chromosome 9 open reading frame 96 [Seminavis robusta]|uniref:Chromosome 9 open reading frame 96 n=1 Tax=Seminavis robusta TaxID=568900 RepID=A0A9N8EVC9_9STRA|nr:chromosome 9 open reading frame 96 [Seminavis robusta]|eukprot:Sro1987_g309580.1 chromosome 9 open reading frame 96 (292) ;mRNA; f:14715-15590
MAQSDPPLGPPPAKKPRRVSPPEPELKAELQSRTCCSAETVVSFSTDSVANTTVPDDECSVQVLEIKKEEDEIPDLLFVELQKENVEDVVSALKRMRELFLSSNTNAVKNWKAAAPLGPISLVVLAMRKWPDHQDIQNYSCRSLANMLSVSWKHGLGKFAMVKSGGIEAVVRSLKTFSESLELQFVGCCTLMNAFKLHPNDPRSVAEGMIRFVENLDGIDIIVGMMKRFPDHVGLLSACCTLLIGLTVIKNNHGTMIKNGAVEAVACVQKNHCDNESLKKRTIKFLMDVFA